MAEEAAVAPEQSAEDLELLTNPVKPLFNKYAWVTMQGMIAQVIMVVLEGVVMGLGLGAHGLACVSILMSVEYINLSFGNLFGTGLPTVIGNRLGAGDREGAKHAFSQGFWFTTYVSVIVAVVFEVFAEPLAVFFGATPDILADSALGIRIFGALLVFTIIGQMIAGVLRVIEMPRESANLLTGSAIVSIIFLAVTVLLLDWGIVGAAIYYGITIGLWAVGIVYFIGNKTDFEIRAKDMAPDFAVWGEIVKVGFPFFVTQAGTFVYNVVANNLLGALGGENGSLFIGAFAVINGYITYIIMMFNNALAYGLQPVASVNNGAKQHGRLKEALNWSIIVQVVLSLVLTAVVLVFATQLSNFFDGGDPVLTEASAHAVRIMCAASALGFMATIVSSYFQAVEKVVLATIVSLLRYVILACPLMVLVSNMMGTVDGVWYGLLAADVLCGIICLALVFVENRRLDGLKSA